MQFLGQKSRRSADFVKRNFSIFCRVDKARVHSATRQKNEKFLFTKSAERYDFLAKRSNF